MKIHVCRDMQYGFWLVSSVFLVLVLLKLILENSVNVKIMSVTKVYNLKTKN